MPIRDAGRYWRTLKHLDARQLGWLFARRVLRLPWRIAKPPNAGLGSQTEPITPLRLPARIYLGDNRFRFLNHEINFGASIDWNACGEARLWQYNLHYFDWLRQDNIDDRTVLGQISDWITANPAFGGIGWEPYPVSLRLVNWSYAMERIEPRGTLPDNVISNYVLQAAWLAANLEHHVRANHLFTNAKALLFAGVLLDGPFADQLLDTAIRLLDREIDEQFLTDGGHYERSPMYHGILTADLLELANLVAKNPQRIPATLTKKISVTVSRALKFALGMAMPDGTIALFNDAAHGIAPKARLLAQYARDVLEMPIPFDLEDEVCSFEDSGYFVVRRDDDILVIDCGLIGPDYQPGHAHCDTLSFELVLNNRRIVTDTGNFAYDAGPERDYARSTPAHNTVEVDETDQCEIWGAFRVGRRARPMYAQLEARPGGAFFSGSHNGYHHLPGRVTHTREIDVGTRFDVRICDRIVGSGPHRAVSRVHFAHDLAVVAQGDGFEVWSRDGGLLAVVEDIAAPEVTLEQTERYPEFGLCKAGTSLIMRANGELPLEFRYTIRKPN